jgi:predicted DNA binding CopG/RHH family protein
MPESVTGFDWDAGNRDKCRKHGVSLEDIEALFRGSVAIHPARGARSEQRFIAIGVTPEKRNVLVVFTLRVKDGRTLIRPISARYMHEREVSSMKKKLPRLKSDKEAEAFVANSDLTQYDLSEMRMVRFEFEPKTERVNMRLPRTLLEAVKARAAKQGIPYQRYIRQTLENAVGSSKR